LTDRLRLWQPTAMEVRHPLKAWRSDNQLSQREAAGRLGIGKPTISRIESWKRTPSLALAAKLSEKTGIPIDKFVRAA
jgi:transcriptional regulator with XRE-family HTH domain